MRILVTGAKGFIGKNLIVALKSRGFSEIDEFDMDRSPSLLDQYCGKANFVFHLAGVNRSFDSTDFLEGNVDLTVKLTECLKRKGNLCPILYSSSVQATLDNEYGKSKKAAEDVLITYSNEMQVKVFLYRLPNVFGKWCRPNYNSVVATFCHNIAGDLPIKIDDPEKTINLVSIDDLTDEFIRVLKNQEEESSGYLKVPDIHPISLTKLSECISSFRECEAQLTVPNLSEAFTRKLYSTYLTYLPEPKLRYPLKMNRDHRGSFTEFMRFPNYGQLSVNIINPGITKGNHWHNGKCERFLTVSGNGVIQLRKINTGQLMEFEVSAAMLEVIEIPPGYTHNISNTGDTDMVVLIWANEGFDSENPDTYYLEV